MPEFCAAGEGDGDGEWLGRARALLESDRYRHSPIDEIARRLKVPGHVLRRRFARLTGLSASRHRVVRTIDRACELMQTTGLLDRQIAERLGFCDEFYFSRRFREITGRSPREFRAILPSGS